MIYDKEFEEWFAGYVEKEPYAGNIKPTMYLAWLASNKDHYRIGEEVEAKEKCRPFMTSAELTMLESAILNPTVMEGKTDSEKLSIAVKALKWALEYIGDGLLPEETPDHECGYTKAPDEGYCVFCESYWLARDALKEIQE